MSGKRPSSPRSRSRSVESTEPDIWCISRERRGPGTQADFVALHDAGKFSANLRELVRSTAEDAPTGKPGYLLALAHQLHSAEEVPKRLREVFEKLVILADGDEQ